MFQSERGSVGTVGSDKIAKALLVAAGAGLLVGAVLGSRALNRTIKITLAKMLVRKVLNRIF